MKRMFLMVALLALTLTLTACDKKKDKPEKPDKKEALALLKKGNQLWFNTKRDKNGKSCNSCHEKGQNLNFDVKFPKEIEGLGKANLPQAIHNCNKTRMEAKPLNKQEVKALIKKYGQLRKLVRKEQTGTAKKAAAETPAETATEAAAEAK